MEYETSREINRVLISGEVLSSPRNIDKTKQNGNRLFFRIHNDWPSRTPQDYAVVVFGKLAEEIYPKCTKGAWAIIDGRLNRSDFVDQNGVDRVEYEIIAQNIKIIA